jgi:hypothetical protein
MGYILNLSGNPSYLSAPNNSAYDFGTGDFTLQCWVKTTASGTVISRKPTPGGYNNGGFLLLIRPDGGIKIAVDNGFGYSEFDNTSIVINDGSWHFLSGIRRDGVLEIHVDGVAYLYGLHTANAPGSVSVSNDSPLYIGSIEQSQEVYSQFTGELKEVRIWNYALTSDQLMAWAYKKLLGNEPGLVGYFNFSNANGNDTSITNNDAVAVGTVGFLGINKFYRAYGIEVPANTMITINCTSYSSGYQAVYFDINGYDPIWFAGAGEGIPLTCNGQKVININSGENQTIWITFLYSINETIGPFYASTLSYTAPQFLTDYTVVSAYAANNAQDAENREAQIMATIQYSN